jgi:F0F1-type ATP synthase gamma subunit
VLVKNRSRPNHMLLDVPRRARSEPDKTANKNAATSRGSGTPIIFALIPEYLFVSLFKVCAESLARENAIRLAAMKRAIRARVIYSEWPKGTRLWRKTV